ncbi:hypothetical protein L1987_80769 [Smallanthus sonchifolius]|uniref:Uncharacterized protein n=1 Tax=Smallanthus sonchifolius TaxID=185202 RepID=A0ACB8YPN5_9ASTR|nr:hypothetical protein L1987_80769 [Smallanthus sonchifolius]
MHERIGDDYQWKFWNNQHNHGYGSFSNVTGKGSNGLWIRANNLKFQSLKKITTTFFVTNLPRDMKEIDLRKQCEVWRMSIYRAEPCGLETIMYLQMCLVKIGRLVSYKSFDSVLMGQPKPNNDPVTKLNVNIVKKNMVIVNRGYLHGVLLDSSCNVLAKVVDTNNIGNLSFYTKKVSRRLVYSMWVVNEFG